MKTKVFSFVALLVLFLSLTTKAQEIADTSIVRIITNDGNEYVGEIIARDSAKIYLKTQYLGELAIPLIEIKSTEKVNFKQIKDGKLWFDNPQSTRYFWSPNGYGLKQGEGYYQNIWVLWNQFSYGISDNFSLGGGVIPLFLFAGAPTPVFLTPKISIPIQENRFSVGAGALLGTILGESATGFGIVYGLATFGNRDDNVTFGLGYGFAGGEWASSPTININGMFRLGSRAYFITENYYIDAGGESVVVISLGGRWIIQKAALDFGLVVPVADIGEFLALPWLGFTIPFGKTN